MDNLVLKLLILYIYHRNIMYLDLKNKIELFLKLNLVEYLKYFLDVFLYQLINVLFHMILKQKVYITNIFPKIIIAKLKNQAGFYGAVSEL